MLTGNLFRTAALCLALGWGGAPLAHAQGYPNPYPRPGADKVMENDRVVVWNATWPTGVATPLHEHRLDQLSVTVAGGTVRVTTADGRAGSTDAPPGTVRFLWAGTIHQEEGTSAAVKRAYMVELKRPMDEKAVPAVPRTPPPPTGITARSFAPGNATQVLDNDRVQAWDVTFPREVRWNEPVDCCDTLRVAVTEDGHPAGGDAAFLYAPAGQAFPPLETTAGAARAVFVLLK